MFLIFVINTFCYQSFYPHPVRHVHFGTKILIIRIYLLVVHRVFLVQFCETETTVLKI